MNISFGSSDAYEQSHSIVKLDRFILATRDSGYKSTVSALAELVDNAIQAKAKNIHINSTYQSETKEIEITIFDNGMGMSPEELRQSLRFGGSTRFDSRKGLGRFGMGLPNASLSQCQRVEIYSWQNKKTYETYLDVEEISQGKFSEVPEPILLDEFLVPPEINSAKSGTLIKWKKCDRLDNKRISTLETKLRKGLGQQFRHFLWNDVKIFLNGACIDAIDPLGLRDQNLKFFSKIFEEIELPFRLSNNRGVSHVKAIFTQLPLAELHKLSNKEKASLGITKGAGISIIRSGREIDFGWFFMDKRKENYDDWWRAELSFEPDMDEFFGVSHTKQQIKPSGEITKILSDQFSPVIRALNTWVRETNLKLKITGRPSQVEHRFKSLNGRLPKISERIKDLQKTTEEYLHLNFPMLLKKEYKSKDFEILEDNIEALDFYSHYFYKDRIFLVLNKRHQFYKNIYAPLKEEESSISEKLLDIIDTLLLTAARAEQQIEKENDALSVENFRREWGGLLSKIAEV